MGVLLALTQLKEHSKQLINAVLRDNGLEVNVMLHDSFCLEFPLVASKINQEYVIVADGDYSEEERQHLQRFLEKEVYVISEKKICWQMGDYVNNKKTEIVATGSNRQNWFSSFDSPKIYLLPKWIDDLIFEELNAEYAPDHIKFEYNLNKNKNEVLTYLGTYFPRSYAEVYYLFSQLLFTEEQKSFVSENNVLRILDLGCGTGGDILGLLNYIEDNLDNIQLIKILAIDGNHYALRVLEKILEAYKSKTRLQIEYTIGPVFIESEDDLNLISEVVSAKFDIEDVTVKNNGEFIPVTLNTELNEFIKENPNFVTLLPMSCKRNGNKCSKGCFFKEEIKVKHSRKDNDISKIVYRFISHRQVLNIFESSNVVSNIQCKIN